MTEHAILSHHIRSSPDDPASVAWFDLTRVHLMRLLVVGHSTAVVPQNDAAVAGSRLPLVFPVRVRAHDDDTLPLALLALPEEAVDLVVLVGGGVPLVQFVLVREPLLTPLLGLLPPHDLISDALHELPVLHQRGLHQLQHLLALLVVGEHVVATLAPTEQVVAATVVPEKVVASTAVPTKDVTTTATAPSKYIGPSLARSTTAPSEDISTASTSATASSENIAAATASSSASTAAPPSEYVGTAASSSSATAASAENVGASSCSSRTTPSVVRRGATTEDVCAAASCSPACAAASPSKNVGAAAA